MYTQREHGYAKSISPYLPHIHPTFRRDLDRIDYTLTSLHCFSLFTTYFDSILHCIINRMALVALPVALRASLSGNATSSHCLRRSLHSSPTQGASILFALSALSNSRETQHFNKLTRLPRVEHSPPLKLIQSSEVDQFPCPVPPRPALIPLVRHVGGFRSALRVWDQKALQAGRVILADQARRTHRLTQALAQAKRREMKADVLMKRERMAWQQERAKMTNDMRVAGAWILVSIGTATVLATWRFWPQREAVHDSGVLGRKIAARAAAAMPLPRAVSVEPTITAPLAVSAPASSPPIETAMTANNKITAQPRRSSWWQSLFWKQP